jgi:hypothetical protein
MRSALAALALCALSLTACGGDDDSAEPTAGSGPGAASGADATVAGGTTGGSGPGAASGADATVADDEPATSQAGPGAASGADATVTGDSGSEYCDLIRYGDEHFDDLESDMADPQAAPGVIDELNDVFDQLEANAPEEIEDELDLQLEYTRAYLELFVESGYDPNAPSDELDERFSDPKYDEAIEAVENYSNEVCGVGGEG